MPGDLGCLLETLARCPRLTALGLRLDDDMLYNGDGPPAPGLAAFANLRSLTSLTWTYENTFYDRDPCLTDLVDALAPLTGLADLSVDLCNVPIALYSGLASFTGLRSLAIRMQLEACAIDPWCLNLPKLLTLTFVGCHFNDEDMLPNLTALPSLTRIEFCGCKGPPECVQHVLAQLAPLPRLQHCVLRTENGVPPCAWFLPQLLRMPFDMGSLSSMLLRLDLSGLMLPLFHWC